VSYPTSLVRASSNVAKKFRQASEYIIAYKAIYLTPPTCSSCFDTVGRRKRPEKRWESRFGFPARM
jgi:hypothetical protein